MSIWGQLADEADPSQIAHQLVLECTQLSIPALREDPVGVIDSYTGIKLIYSREQAEAGCGKGEGYYRAEPRTYLTISACFRQCSEQNAAFLSLTVAGSSACRQLAQTPTRHDREGRGESIYGDCHCCMPTRRLC